MREINECTAEVFRRSEKRIKERRKKRNRILALCIPLCLIVTVWSVMLLPKMMPATVKKDDTAEMATDNYSGGSAAEMVGDAAQHPAYPYASVEIQNVGSSPEYRETVTNKLAVTKIFISVHSLFADADGADLNGGEPFGEYEDNVQSSQTASTSNWNGYTLIFTAEDGSQTVYNLSENTLMNVNTHETAILSDTQVTGLMTVLGISE